MKLMAFVNDAPFSDTLCCAIGFSDLNWNCFLLGHCHPNKVEGTEFEVHSSHLVPTGIHLHPYYKKWKSSQSMKNSKSTANTKF